MAQIKVELNTTDIVDAIDMWVRAKGMVPKGRARIDVVDLESFPVQRVVSATIEADLANPQR